MNRKKIFITILTISIMAFSSCDDWLYLEPEDGIVRQEFWQTKEQVESAVIGCYASMLDNNLAERLFLWGELRADMLIPNSGIRYDELNIMYGNITPDNSVTNWSAFYKTINFCNTVIELSPQVLDIDNTFTETQLKNYTSEALAIRSLMYFYLVRAFGEVPLKTDATISDDQDISLPKNSRYQIIRQILNDLKVAEANAVTTYNNVNHDKGRVTKYMINALQADVYLWNDQYDSCIIACDKVINSGNFGLIDGEDNWYKKLYVDGNSNESIFELQFDYQKLNPYYSMFSTTSGRRFLASPHVLEELYTLDFEDSKNKDIRGEGASVRSGNSSVWKYLGWDDRNGRSEDESYAHWIIYRFADIMLMKAEALNRTGEGQQALDIIELIRTRANALEATREDLQPFDEAGIEEYILKERNREFAYEGKRWFDLLRISKRDKYSNMSLLIDMVIQSAPPERQQTIINKYRDTLSHYFPIYYYELETNVNLEQNPFYLQ